MKRYGDKQDRKETDDDRKTFRFGTYNVQFFERALELLETRFTLDTQQRNWKALAQRRSHALRATKRTTEIPPKQPGHHHEQA